MYYGGVVDQRDILTLKKLLFRSTRGRAILSTFELRVDPEDIIRGEDFHKTLVGYLVMFEGGPLHRIVERICQSFNSQENRLAFEITPRSVASDLKGVISAKNDLRELIVTSKQTFFEYLSQYVTPE